MVHLLVSGKLYDLGKQKRWQTWVLCATSYPFPMFTLRMDNRYASAQWERQREREASRHDKVDHIDDFVDTGNAQRFFQTNRERIIRHFAGTSEHTEGTYDWYASWEKWARQQWEQQQQQQQGQARQQGYTQQQKTRRSKQQATRPRNDYVWDFDPNDP